MNAVRLLPGAHLLCLFGLHQLVLSGSGFDQDTGLLFSPKYLECTRCRRVFAIYASADQAPALQPSSRIGRAFPGVK